LQLLEVLLSVRPRLHHGARLHHGRDLLPLFPKLPQRFQEHVVLALGPSPSGFTPWSTRFLAAAARAPAAPTASSPATATAAAAVSATTSSSVATILGLEVFFESIAAPAPTTRSGFCLHLSRHLA
jgi:hypothetical protein